MEWKFMEQTLSARKVRAQSAEVTPDKAVLQAFGGDPLAGSGFETEEPDPGFSVEEYTTP
jgi:hypothetical protein